MASNRKYIRIAIPADSVKAFDEAKSLAEKSAMIKLTDTQFASRLIQMAVATDTDKSK